MSDATPLPRMGEVFFDDRGEERALRLSWHSDAAVMVLSIWNRGVCSGTFRLMSRDVPAFIEALTQGVPPAQPRSGRHAASLTGETDASYGQEYGQEYGQDAGGPATEAFTPPFANTGSYVTTGQYATGGQHGALPPATGGQHGAPTSATGAQYPATPSSVAGVQYGATPSAAQYGTTPSSATGGQYAAPPPSPQHPAQAVPSQAAPADPLEVLKSLGTPQQPPAQPDYQYPRTGEYQAPRRD